MPRADTVGTTRYFTLKCDVIQCSRKRTLSTYAFGDWVGMFYVVGVCVCVCVCVYSAVQ